jgi:hypothetical protein
MAATTSVDQTADRTALLRKVALVRRVRCLVDQVESLYSEFDQSGALVEIRRYSLIHDEQIPPLDLLQIAKLLRCYAGTLSLIAKTAPKPEPPAPADPVDRTRPRMPCARIENGPQLGARKRGQQINRVELRF